MENKINVAELLLNCPKGMPLDCSMWDNVTLNSVIINDTFPIKVAYPTNDGDTYTTELTKYGGWSNVEAAKCVIFPKDKTTWEGFVPPKFKDGDILAEDEDDTIYIYNGVEDNLNHFVYAIVNSRGLFSVNSFSKKYSARYATEKEKEILFKAIKENGYEWYQYTKTLVKLFKPNFEVGDEIENKNTHDHFKIICVKSDKYIVENVGGGGSCSILMFNTQDEWKLVKKEKFDISKLKAFESKVLVRDSIEDVWRPAIFGAVVKKEKEMDMSFVVVGGGFFEQCIPYMENEHLLGTTDDCCRHYKTWIPTQ